MKHIPILFSTEMIISKLAGRKTKTRRIINPQPTDEWMQNTRQFSPGGNLYDRRGRKLFWIEKPNYTGSGDSEIRCPYGQPGDVLWTRENFKIIGWNWEDNEMHVEYGNGDVVYMEAPEDQTWLGNYIDKLTHLGIHKLIDPENEESPYELTGKKHPQTPSIFMPKPACRMWDEVVSIRVERVAEISESDAIAEGILSCTDEAGIRYKDYMADHDGNWHPNYGHPDLPPAVLSYRSLWQKINGTPKPIQKKINGKLVTVAYEAYPFDEEAAHPLAGLTEWRGKPLTVILNPWVFMIEFKPINKPENWPV